MVDVDQLRSQQTNGLNCGLVTEDIIAKLQEWDEKYGIQTSDIDVASVMVRFESVPDDTGPLADEIYRFCPDTVDQHFGCFEEMLDTAEEMGKELDSKVIELVEGIDFSDENYGVVLLARSIKRDKTVALWWD